jgi:hypothetical protein
MAFACETNSSWLNGAVPAAPLAPLAPLATVVLLLLLPPQPAKGRAPTATHPAIVARPIRLMMLVRTDAPSLSAPEPEKPCTAESLVLLGEPSWL